MTSDVPPIAPTGGEIVNPATTATQGTGSGGAGAEVTHVSSMGDLRAKAPEVYKAIMMGFALAIISEQRRHLERFKKLQREGMRQ